VGDSPHQNTTRSAAADLGRRQFMRKAAVAGTLVWTVPTIVSIQPAGAADRHSARPKPPVGGVVEPPIVTPTTAATQLGPTRLAFTGDNEIVEFGVGLAALAGGTALILSAAEPERVGLGAEGE
jgi:hypothetical protein